MNSENRRGFTLVELLVVIVIISMLAGLLIPAVISARASARRTECENNQHQLALAIQQYENATQRMPGYLNTFAGNTLGWPVVIFQYLGRNDLWEEWRGGGTAVVGVDQFVCPADPQSETAALSYVVNCGLDDTWSFQSPLPSPFPDPPDKPENAVFLDRTNTDSAPVMSERIADGAAQTLMLSENVQAGEWNDTSEETIGMVWVPAATDANNNNKVDDDTDPPAGWMRVNEDLDATGSDIEHARPSSRHPGGAVVTYCDGHQAFLDEGVEYDIYRAQMVPDDSTDDYFAP